MFRYWHYRRPAGLTKPYLERIREARTMHYAIDWRNRRWLKYAAYHKGKLI